MAEVEVGSKNLHVGIFDDESAVRNIFRQALELSGHTTWESERANVTRGHHLLDSLDVVIIDVDMPGDSHDLARYFKEKGTPVIRCSSHEESAIPEDARGDRHLLKPVRLKTLQETVAAVARKR